MWLLGWWIAAVIVGGVVQVFADTRPGPKVERTVEDDRVLPADQVTVTGTFTSVQGADVNAPALPLPFGTDTGSVLVKEAIVDGKATTAVWQGGRPFRLTGTSGAGIDVSPTTVTIDATGTARWPLDGEHRLLPGRYTIDSPVAVGSNGLAAPMDTVSFIADARTTIETHGGTSITTPPRKLHLEGPGRLVLDGTFTVQDTTGSRPVTHIDFGAGPFVLDLDGTTLTGTLQGRVRAN